MLLLLRFFQNPKKRDFLRFFALLHMFSRTMPLAIVQADSQPEINALIEPDFLF